MDYYFIEQQKTPIYNNYNAKSQKQIDINVQIVFLLRKVIVLEKYLEVQLIFILRMEYLIILLIMLLVI